MNRPAESAVDTARIELQGADAAEELARADMYGLLARLWIGPPDPPLFDHFATAVTQAPEAGGFLEAPWTALVGAMRDSSIESAADEYNRLFMGIGRPEVMLYGSYYLSGFLNEQPLADLRSDLARLGLGRDETRFETEDHAAHVFEVMRYLIAGDDVAICNLEQQRQFFRTHLQPWVGAMCDAVAAHPAARLYRAAAGLTEAFVLIETQAFDMID